MENRNLDYDIVIIGAGLTGLTTAFRLVKEGKRPLVIEEACRVGGQIATHEHNGYVYESGPNTGAISHPEIAELFEMLDGKCKLEIADPAAKRRLILKGGKFHALPSGLGSAIATPLFNWYDKFRILGEPFRKKGTNPNESVGEMVKRRLGKSFLDYAVDPFISGVYAGNPMNLITRFALPKLYALEQNYGSFIKGAIAKSKEPKTDRDRKATKEVFSVEGGLSHLIEALADGVGRSHIILGAKDVAVKPLGDSWQISFAAGDEQTVVNCRKVVTTCPAYRLPKLLPFADDDRICQIASLPYASLMQVSVGLAKRDDPNLKAFGGLIPTKEKENILGILFPHACFKHRAPEGKALYSVFIGGVKRPELMQKSDEEVIAITKDAFSRMLGYGQNMTIEHIDICRHERVIPQYDASCEKCWANIESLEKDFPGLYIAGNIKGGIGMADRIKQGMTLAFNLSRMED